MMWVRTFGTLGLAILVAACADNYATFVTSTDIGISADATTQDLHLGYVRTELFVGPAYPAEGAAPSAVGYLGSNLSAFSPKIKQLYATGDAAELVTQGTSPGIEPAASEKLGGERRPMLFGTGSNLGLQVGFAGGTPSKVKFGYNREELSIIPLHREPPSANAPDKYASVLAAINMDQSVTTQADSTVRLTQFFATGAAARNLAKRPEIQGYFGEQAKSSVKAALSSDYSYDDSSKKIEAFWMPDGKIINQENATKIKSCMVKNKIEGSVPFLINAQSKAKRDTVITCLQI